MAVTVRRRDPLRDRIRENIPLLGVYNEENKEFFLPEPAVHDPPGRQVKVVHGSRRLQYPTEYTITESSPGRLDKVVLVFAPRSTGRLYADYLAAII